MAIGTSHQPPTGPPKPEGRAGTGKQIDFQPGETPFDTNGDTPNRNGRSRRERRESRFTKKHKFGAGLAGLALLSSGGFLASRLGGGDTESNNPPVTSGEQPNPGENNVEEGEALETEHNPLGISKDVFNDAIDIGKDGDPQKVYPAGTAFDLGETGWSVYVGDTIIGDDLVAEANGPDYSPHSSIGDSTHYALLEFGVVYEGDDVSVTGGFDRVVSNIGGDADFTFITPSGEVIASGNSDVYDLKRFNEYGNDIDRYPEIGEVVSGYVLVEAPKDSIEDGVWVIADQKSYDDNLVRFHEIRVDTGSVEVGEVSGEQIEPAAEEPANPEPNAEQASFGDSQEILGNWQVSIGEPLRGQAVIDMMKQAKGEDGYRPPLLGEYVAVPYKVSGPGERLEDTAIPGIKNAVTGDDLGPEVDRIHMDTEGGYISESLLEPGEIDYGNYESYLVFEVDPSTLVDSRFVLEDAATANSGETSEPFAIFPLEFK